MHNRAAAPRDGTAAPPVRSQEMTHRKHDMNKLVPAVLTAAFLAFSSSAPAGDRYHGYHGGYGGHGYGHYKHRHCHRPSFSLVLGAPLYWPSYYHRPYGWYVRPPVIVQQAPIAYVQREVPAAPAVTQSNYWYYCPDTRSYYPYTQTCPSEWLQVVPQTAPR